LIDQARRPPIGAAFPVAFVGALISAAGEPGTRTRNLRLDTHSGPIAAGTSLVDF